MSVERIEFDVVSHRRIEQRALGEWNLVEIKCVGDEARHYLNGELVAHIDDIRIADGDDARPLSAGTIQLQSESAEVFFRRIEVRSIESFDE